MGQTQSALDDGYDVELNTRELEANIGELVRVEGEQAEHSDRIFHDFRLWAIACQRAGQEFQNKFRSNLLNAFHELSDVTQLVLEAPDGHLNHPGNAHIVVSILKTKVAFDNLLDTSKSALKNLSDESQEAFVEEAIVFNKIEELKKYEIKVKGSCGANENAARVACRDLGEARSRLDDAEYRLRRRIDELDNFFDNTFTDKAPILSPFEASVNREAARFRYHETYAKLSDDLCRVENEILDHLCHHIHRLEQLMGEMQQEEHSIIHAKEASSELFSRIYDMEICFKSRDILVDKTDFLRHILQVLHVNIIQDSDEFPAIRAAIYQHFSNHMTSEEIQSLEETKDYLVMDI